MQAKTFRYKERWRAKKVELPPHFHGSLVWNRVRARQKDSGTRTGPLAPPSPVSIARHDFFDGILIPREFS